MLMPLYISFLAFPPTVACTSGQSTPDQRDLVPDQLWLDQAHYFYWYQCPGWGLGADQGGGGDALAHLRGPLRRLALMHRIRGGTHATHPVVTHLLTPSLRASFDREIAIHVDGESTSATTVDIGVRREELSIATIYVRRFRHPRSPAHRCL